MSTVARQFVLVGMRRLEDHAEAPRDRAKPMAPPACSTENQRHRRVWPCSHLLSAHSEGPREELNGDSGQHHPAGFPTLRMNTGREAHPPVALPHRLVDYGALWRPDTPENRLEISTMLIQSPASPVYSWKRATARNSRIIWKSSPARANRSVERPRSTLRSPERATRCVWEWQRWLKGWDFSNRPWTVAPPCIANQPVAHVLGGGIPLGCCR